MKKRILAVLLMVVILAALFAGLSVTAAAENDISGDSISGYVIAYTLAKDDTVLKVCNKLGIDFYKNQALITKINNIADYSKLPVGKVVWLPATSVGSAKDYYTLKSHKVVSGDNVNTLLTKYGIASTDTMLSRVNNNLASPTVGSTLTFPVYTGDSTAKIADTTAAAIGGTAAAAAATGISTTTGTTAVTSGNVAYYLMAYTMKQGDTVGAVCTANGINFNQNSALISRINGITNYNRIPVGRTIMIPTGTATGATYSVVAHQIQGGETANDICASYGTSLANNLTLVKGLNNTNNLNYIPAGGILYVPVLGSSGGGGGEGGGGGITPTPTPTPSGNVYNLSKDSSTNGSFVLKVDGVEASSANAGKTVVIVCNGDSGYAQKKIDVHMTGDLTKKVDVINNTFVVPEFHVTVGVTFEKANNYAVTCPAPTNGTFELYADEKIVTDKTYEGAAVSVKCKPDTGYMIESIEVYKTGDKTKKTPVTDNKFTMPGYPVTVEVKFKPSAGYEYPLDSDGTPSHGTYSLKVNNNVAVKAASGKTVVVSCSPDKDYKLNMIQITYPVWNASAGVSENKTVLVSNKQFKMPTFDDNIKLSDRKVKVKVSFIQTKTYSITLVAGGNNNVIFARAEFYDGPVLNGKAEVGRKVVIVPNINPGYQLASYTVKYGSTTINVTDPSADASFTMPAANVTVTPNFVKATPALNFTASPSATWGAADFTVNNQAGQTKAAPGSTVHMEFTPAMTKLRFVSVSGYYLYNGQKINITIKSGNNFTMPPYDAQITGVFERFMNKVTMATNANVTKIEYKVNSQTVADGGEVAEGDNVTIMPTMASGYVVKEIKVTYVENGETKEVPVDSSYKFVMPKFDVTVTITETKDPAYFAINIKNVSNGSIQVLDSGGSPVDKAKEGVTLTVVCTGAKGYKYKDGTLTVKPTNGGTSLTLSGMKFTMPGEAVDVVAEFEIVDYKVTPYVEAGGTLSCNGSAAATTAHCGVTIPYSVATTASGYEFKKVEIYKVVGSTETLIQEFTATDGSFEMPDSDIKVVAVFRELLTGFAIEKADTSHGNFDVLIGTEIVTSATENQTITVSAHPVDGYKVGSITVDGTAISISNPTFKMPAHSVTVAVTFVEDK